MPLRIDVSTRIWVLAVVLTSALACGKKGPPYPPEPRGPHAARAVFARQIGEETRVWFELPPARGERPSQQLGQAELIRVSYAPGFTVPADPNAFGRRGEIVGLLDLTGRVAATRVTVADGRLAELEDGGRDWTLRYAIRLNDVRGRASALGPAGDLVLGESAPAPTEFTAEPTSDGVRLAWSLPAGWTPPEPEQLASSPAPLAPAEDPGLAPAEDAATPDDDAATPDENAAAPAEEPGAVPRVTFNVYRAAPGEAFPERPINPFPIVESEYLDTDVEMDARYVYGVRIMVADRPSVREGRTAGPVEVYAIDRFAPAPPQALLRVQEGMAVRLFWRPNDEPDLAGYRVYRRVRGERWERIGEDPIRLPSFVDRDVRVGQRLSYRVSAVDRVSPPNESEFTEPVEIEIVAEPNAAGD